MVGFATAITDRATYDETALPGIQRAAEADSAILTRFGCDSIQRAYNEIMDEAATMSGLEALVFLHQDLELLDESLPRRVRRVFEDPTVGVFGALGGRLTNLHRWLAPDGKVFGYQIGPDRPAGDDPSITVGSHEVDVVDGALIVAAPWVTRYLRFSEALAGGFHGYDVDISARVRAHGGKVICEDIPCYHHRRIGDDYDGQRDAGAALARMWDPLLRPREWRSSFQQ